MPHTSPLTGAIDSTRDAIVDTKDNLADAASRVQDKVSSKFDNGRTAAANKLADAAESLHERVNRIGEIGHDAADRVDATARYLKKHSAKEMASDLGELVRAHPGKSLLVAAAAGFIVARAFRSSND